MVISDIYMPINLRGMWIIRQQQENSRLKGSPLESHERVCDLHHALRRCKRCGRRHIFVGVADREVKEEVGLMDVGGVVGTVEDCDSLDALVEASRDR